MEFNAIVEVSHSVTQSYYYLLFFTLSFRAIDNIENTHNLYLWP